MAGAIELDDVNLPDGFESFMYEFNRDGTDYILRLQGTLGGVNRSDARRGRLDQLSGKRRGRCGSCRTLATRQPGGSDPG